MAFDPCVYGEKVAAILALDAHGERLMPLARGVCSSAGAARMLRATTASELFPHSRAPEAALSGLYLYFSCMEESHNLSQEIETPDGSFWHGILHRQEPDAGNAAYWFRRVGRHPVFPALCTAAEAIGVHFGAQWDPLAFIDLCERARQRPGSDEERRALEIQRAEWQLLFDSCASTATQRVGAGPA